MSYNDFEVTFWGVRGSSPTFGPDMREFGGNTSCVQIQIGNRLLIFDAGTGIQTLGRNLLNRKKDIKGHIFITHTHWDHIQGLPFFRPFFHKKNTFQIYGQRKSNLSFSSVIKDIMKYPYSPIRWDNMEADLNFKEIDSEDIIDIGDGITTKSIKTDHPDDCLAYRVDYKNKSCCYITDLEHSKEIDEELKRFVKGTDILIYDSNFTDDEYYGAFDKPNKKGWGHSTWQKGVRLAKEASVGKLVLFHHKLERTDDELLSIESKAKNNYKKTVVAREGMKIHI
ncbi:MAG: MBL fold metallo-hydrolase [Firmicutes bacterium]|nr:MBL fold metallo-hydrolase [Bacillota bacterium]